MTITDITQKLDDNYRAIDGRLSRMDLELLPGIMEERTRLVRDFVCRLDGSDNDVETRQAIDRIREQNFHLEARIAERMQRAQAELNDLRRLAQRDNAYAQAQRGSVASPPSEDYC